jgi:hypothetical protein
MVGKGCVRQRLPAFDEAGDYNVASERMELEGGCCDFNVNA